MASIDSLTFDQAAYNPGDLITLTVGYTPDSPSVVPTTFTATAVISDANGNQLATSSAPFVINVSQPAGDTVSVTDTDNHAWAETAGSDTGSSVVFTTTA
jgi:hypothetical protein